MTTGKSPLDLSLLAGSEAQIARNFLAQRAMELGRLDVSTLVEGRPPNFRDAGEDLRQIPSSSRRNSSPPLASRGGARRMREIHFAEYVWRVKHNALQGVEGALIPCPVCKTPTRILVARRTQRWCPACAPARQCARCEKWKELVDFSAVSIRDGESYRLDSYCDPCARARSAEQYHKPRAPTRPVAKYATCRECRRELLAEAHFSADPRTKSGWNYICNACTGGKRNERRTGRPMCRPRRGA